MKSAKLSRQTGDTTDNVYVGCYFPSYINSTKMYTMLLKPVASPLQSFHLSHPLQYMTPYRSILYICIFETNICCCAFIVIQMKKYILANNRKNIFWRYTHSCYSRDFVVCNQHLYAEYGGSATIFLKVTKEIYQI